MYLYEARFSPHISSKITWNMEADKENPLSSIKLGIK